MIEEIINHLKQAEGQPCWHVSVGGCTLPSFDLVLGEPIKRSVPILNNSQPELFRSHRGKYHILVWCTWRLEQRNDIIVSSDGLAEDIVSGMSRLINKNLLELNVSGPAMDLTMEFSDGYKLLVFCDHTESDPSFDGNWEALVEDVGIYVGPGCKIEKNLVTY